MFKTLSIKSFYFILSKYHLLDKGILNTKYSKSIFNPKQKRVWEHHFDVGMLAIAQRETLLLTMETLSYGLEII